MDVKVLSTKPVLEIDGVKYHLHPNGGGLVAETAEVAETAFVSPAALVQGQAKILDQARIDGASVIRDNAKVYEHAQLIGGPQVSGQAEIFGHSRVLGWTHIRDKARIFGQAVVWHGLLTGQVQVCGSAIIVGGFHLDGDLIVDETHPASTHPISG